MLCLAHGRTTGQTDLLFLKNVPCAVLSISGPVSVEGGSIAVIEIRVWQNWADLPCGAQGSGDVTHVSSLASMGLDESFLLQPRTLQSVIFLGCLFFTFDS